MKKLPLLKNSVGILSVATLLCMAACSMQTVSVEPTGHAAVGQSQTEAVSFSFIDKTREPGGPAALIERKPESTIFAHYFDISSGSQAGTAVTGKLNLKGNRRAPAQSPSASYRFELTSESSGWFTLENERDSDGRLFGVFRVKSGVTLPASGAADFIVELLDGDGRIETQQGTIHVVDETEWQRFFRHNREYVLSNSRMWGRYKISAKKSLATVQALLRNEGQFADLDFYDAPLKNVSDTKGWRKKYEKQLEEAARRIGGIAHTYATADTLQNPGLQAEVARALGLAIIAYTESFPVEGFGDFNGIAYNNRTHAWRYTDPLIGGSVLIYPEIMRNDSLTDLRVKLQEAFYRYFGNIAFSLTEGYRSPDQYRYVLPREELLPLTSGGWADANRDHRIRTWSSMVAIWQDYNRPLTDLYYWYDDYEPWARYATALLPEWEPSGSFADMKVWLDTNNQLAHRYFQSGILPDGTISHHIGDRQDFASNAYGFTWATGWLEFAEFLEGGPYEIEGHVFNSTADFLLYTYSSITYRGGLDYQTAGRSHGSDVLRHVGQKQLIPVIDKLLTLAAHQGVEVARKDELLAWREALAAEQDSVSGNIAFWNSDYLIQRRATNSDSGGYYMSVKMQSARTKGAEGFGSDQGFHNGSGIVQVKVDGDEYDRARSALDWHVLPGLTEEWKTDGVPLSSAQKAYNPNHFAGVVSDGVNGCAAFQYDRKDTYASAAANKAYFFRNDQLWCIGNSVRRTRSGQGKPIVTTVEQVEWDHDLVYDAGSGIKRLTVGASASEVFETDAPLWLHQDQVGYVVLPEISTTVTLKTGEAIQPSVSASDSNKSKGHLYGEVLKAKGDIERPNLFHVSIDHGVKPSNGTDTYAWVTAPGISAEDMPDLAKQLVENYTVVNEASHQVVYDQGISLIQGVFYESGYYDLSDDLSVSVSHPALLQLCRSQAGWQVSISDAMQDETLSEIEVELSLKLQAGSYAYATQGMIVESVDGQIVTVSESASGGTVLKVALPDAGDEAVYGHRQQLFVGMPVSVLIPERK